MHGSDIQTDRYYSRHSLPMDENGGRRPVGACYVFRHTSVLEHLDVKWVSLSPLTYLRKISKIRAVGALTGLTLTFLVMASYVLTWEKKGLLFTPPPPDQLRSVVVQTSVAAAVVSRESNSIDMRLLEKLIGSKLEYKPRMVPSVKDVIETSPHLFSMIPRYFLPGIKNPCWFEEVSDQLGPDPYSRNLYSGHSKNFKALCDRLSANFTQHLRRSRDGRLLRLRCFPFFYIIGQPKCGTTDLFHRLLLHPEVELNYMKEPHWWTRKRFGYIRFKDGFQEIFPVEDYLDVFDLAAHKIQEEISGNLSRDNRVLRFITGEASASTMWDNQAWSYLSTDWEDTEPPFLAQDFIHTAQPDARILIMLRDPAERLYSDYLYFKIANKSAEDFHQKVVESVQLFQSCLSERSLRSCAYNTRLFNTMPVRLSLGMYVVYLLDWLTVFRRDQILVIRLEDYASNIKVTMRKVFNFLSAEPLSKKTEAALSKRPLSNTRRAADRNLGPMLPSTRDLLRDFHRPFNAKLARVLDNEAFLWRTGA